MTPGQKQMLAIRKMAMAEAHLVGAITSEFSNVAEYYKNRDMAFIELCEAFGHEVPSE